MGSVGLVKLVSDGYMMFMVCLSVLLLISMTMIKTMVMLLLTRRVLVVEVVTMLMELMVIVDNAL